jgi:ABC-2 type transport system permease protein
MTSSALWLVARTDLRRLRRSGALAAMGVVLTGLVVAAGLVAWRSERAYDAQRQRYADVVGSQWDAQGDRHPHRVSHYGYLLFRPRSPLSLFDAGVTAQSGSTLFLEAHRQNSMNFGEASHADAPLRFGGLSMALVLQLLVPLVVFVAAAGAVAGEREEGTLALVRSQGVSWTAWLGGKTLALTIAAAGLALPGAAVVAAVLAASRDVAWTADATVRTAVLGVVHVVYFALVAALGVVVSAVARTARDATLALVGVWLAVWIVVPRVVPAVGSAAHQLPTRAAFEAEVERQTRALGDSHNPDDPNFAAFKARTMAAAGVSRVEDLPVNYNGIVMIEGERLTTEAYRGMRDALAAARRGHERTATAAAAVSPYLAMRLVSMALSGVDVGAMEAFERQAEDYRYALVQYLNRLHAESMTLAEDRYVRGGAEGEAPSRKRIDAAHWQEAPEFVFRPPTLAEDVGASAGALAVFALWVVAAGLALSRLRPGVA